MLVKQASGGNVLNGQMSNYSMGVNEQKLFVDLYEATAEVKSKQR